jgi:hypothetical protein
VSNIEHLQLFFSDYNRIMPNYRFALLDRHGDHREEAGCLALPDDDEALAFGAAIVRDLSAGATSYADWTIYITESARLVGGLTIPASANVSQPTYIFQIAER